MITTDSGLQYEDTVVGEGAVARASQDVSVHYTGWLYSKNSAGEWVKGAKFDSSRDRNEPFEFELDGGMVIRGWDEGVQGMKVGGTRVLVIPPQLGYGARGAGRDIPPNSTLMFEVTLLGVKGGEAPLDLQLQSTPSGLQFQDTVVGEGKLASAGMEAVVHYTGWLYKDGQRGKKFDSSKLRGQPFEFELGAGQVIRGWDEGVQGMKIGGTRWLVIPPELGYGQRGAGGVIPPGATLIFEVELLGLGGGDEPIVLDLQATASGLRYQDLVVGEGAEAVSGKRVTVHYTGWLYRDGLRGKKFDSSKDRGDPFRFHLDHGQVIAGWDEGVQGMKVGGRRMLVIPAELGYGAQGAGGVIPPHATLLFEVELLAV